MNTQHPSDDETCDDHEDACDASDDCDNAFEESAACEQFHIVGVGASAGGLEAIEKFFDVLPNDTGMAFVLIQHLSPDFKSHMEELLGRHTKMAIHRVEHQMEVEPNNIYLIPPKKEMVISEKKLLLTEKSTDRSLSHPIDQFFRSLASDIGRYAIGVVLSGTGSDGSRGIRDIHDAGGLVVIQDEQSAKFDGMPLNAQATGVSDIILPPKALAEALVKYVRDGLSPEALAEQEMASTVAEGLERVLQLLHEQHGLDFSQYKATTVGRRIDRRINLLKLRSLDEYLERLDHDPSELNALYKDLLIGVTKFFRDPDAYVVLEKQIIPEIFDKAKNDESIRVWSAACATGEEAYSIAILLDEERRSRKVDVQIKVFATDVHHVSLSTAARGIYPAESMATMPEDRLRHYFRKKSDGYHVTSELRRLVVFAPHNVIRDAPFTQMDLVVCRNMLIYLLPKAQKKALSLFHFSLKTNATLFLGPSETPGELGDEFQVRDKRWKIYTKKRDVRLPVQTRLPLGAAEISVAPTAAHKTLASARRVDASLLESYDQLLNRKMPPSIFVDENFDIIHIFGGAERYIQPRGGRPSSKITDAIADPLKSAVSAALQQATRKRDIVRYTGLQVPNADGSEDVTVTVDLIHNPTSQIDNLLIEIESQGVSEGSVVESQSVDMSQFNGQQVSKLEAELRYAQENLQATTEEMETANEELQASNEELVASNEELQSTNEELQSVNEELYTVNAEHQRRVEELALANEDMDNLLATTRVGVIFLDEELLIRRFTPEIARLFHLVPQDVGRAIDGFAHNLKYDSMVADLREVLHQQLEKEVHVEDRNGNPFLMRMVPNLSGNSVAGVVMTLIDISALKSTQRELERFKYMTEAASDPIYLSDQDGRIVYANPAACNALGFDRDQLMKMSVMEVDTQHSRNWYCELFERAETERVQPYETMLIRDDGAELAVEISVSSVLFGQTRFLFSNARDISERRQVEREMRMQRLAIESTKSGILITDALGEDNAIIYVNPGFCEMTGYSEDEVLNKNCRFLQGKETDQEAVAELRQAIVNGKSHRVTLLNYRKNGAPFWNDLQITPVKDEIGRVTNFVGVQADVSDQLNTQVELQKSQEQAQQASVSKSEFLANMSHEIRTPMTAIMGYTEILSKHVKDPDNLNCINIVQRNGQFLLEIINDILDISKIEAGKLEVGSEPFRLDRLLSDVKSLMQIRADEKQLTFSVSFDGKIPEIIKGDAKRLKQVLVNLIGNAIKFTDNGSVKLVVRFDDESENPTLKFEVVDTGIGISRKQQSQIFQPFSQANSAVDRDYGGAGLGLAISQRLAEMMGGKIAVESRLGIGSKFTLSLEPDFENLKLITPSLAEVSKKSAQSSHAAQVVLNGRVLVVDDRRDIQVIVQHFLEDAGAEVVTASNGQDAIDLVNQSLKTDRPFNAIIMDVQMPAMGGLEATRRLRKSGCDIPIIALTAHAMEGDRQDCLAAGCSEYISKPLDGPKLVNLIAKQWEQQPRNEDPALDNASKRVLIVEDSHDVRVMLCELLQLEGHQVHVAATGSQAIAVTKQQKFDLILLDLGLPDMNGTRVVKQLRQLDSSKHTKIVALTGSADTNLTAAAGFDLHLLKPVDLTALQEIVKRCEVVDRENRGETG